MDKEKVIYLASLGYSIIPCNEKKQPIGEWKLNQKKALSPSQVATFDSPLYGLVCGLMGVEVIDVDLKVIKDVKERKDFWNELINLLKDNIYDFEEKFVITKTMNDGYHIIYKTNIAEGNKSIAKRKGEKRSLIETRGVGGMVIIYDNLISKLNYTQIQLISNEDRECLIQCCSIYNYVDPNLAAVPSPKKTKYNALSNTPWDDYNKKTDLWSLISDEFKIVRRLQSKTIIKRLGADSAHSGYIYSDSGFMYLFSTSTIYPSEKLLTPFNVYSHKFHSGDHKKAASDLYKQGYGDRLILPLTKQIKEAINYNKEDLIFPIEIFPESIQKYLIECNSTLNSSIDFMGSGLIWAMAVIIGNTIKVQIKPGWIESPNVWIALVGKAGVGKTPHLNNVIFPLKKANNHEIRLHKKEMERHIEYMNKDDEEKKQIERVKKPDKTQFIASDVTLEALIEMHEENKSAIGIHKDELAGWLKDMNKYRAGSDLEFWLSSWSNEGVSLNRKTAKSNFVEKPLIPIIGGIQPGVINNFYTEENKDNGFIDRLLISYPDINVDHYNEKEIDNKTLEWYESTIINLYNFVKNKLLKYDNNKEVEPFICHFSKKAKKIWAEIYNRITDMQNSDVENEYLKSMLPKQKTYIPRFALIIEFMSRSSEDDFANFEVTDDSVIKAEKLSSYFINMAKKLKYESVETNDLKNVLSFVKNKSNQEKVIEMHNKDKDFNKAKLADLLGVSRMTIHRYIKEYEEKNNKQE